MKKRVAAITLVMCSLVMVVAAVYADLKRATTVQRNSEAYGRHRLSNFHLIRTFRSQPTQCLVQILPPGMAVRRFGFTAAPVTVPATLPCSRRFPPQPGSRGKQDEQNVWRSDSGRQHTENHSVSSGPLHGREPQTLVFIRRTARWGQESIYGCLRLWAIDATRK